MEKNIKVVPWHLMYVWPVTFVHQEATHRRL